MKNKSSDKPDVPPVVTVESECRTESSTARKILIAIGIVIGLGVAVLMLAPSVGGGRIPRQMSTRTQCQFNLRILTLGFMLYHETYGHFPPQYTVDEAGGPLHSWRVLILPFIDENELYESIDLTKPWDDPANRHAHDKCPKILRCPAARLKPGFTNYLGNAWDQGALVPQTGRTILDFKDGLSNSILLFEVRPDQAVPWMSPQDGDYETLIQTLTGQHKLPHPQLVNFAVTDGSTEVFYRGEAGFDQSQVAQLRASLIPFFTIAAGDEVDRDGLILNLH